MFSCTREAGQPLLAEALSLWRGEPFAGVSSERLTLTR